MILLSLRRKLYGLPYVQIKEQLARLLFIFVTLCQKLFLPRPVYGFGGASGVAS